MNFGDSGQRPYVFRVLSDRRVQIPDRGAEVSGLMRQQPNGFRERFMPLYQALQPLIDVHKFILAEAGPSESDPHPRRYFGLP